MKKRTDFLKVRAVIQSCNIYEQLEVCEKLINQYKSLHKLQETDQNVLILRNILFLKSHKLK